MDGGGGGGVRESGGARGGGEGGWKEESRQGSKNADIGTWQRRGGGTGGAETGRISGEQGMLRGSDVGRRGKC